MKAEFESTIQELTPAVVSLRHEFHQHPEIRFEEQWTSDRIARLLDELGVPYERGLAKGTGIVATLDGPAPGKTVALRADIDGLEITEETGLPYASQTPGRMHACGHDGHMACLCGVLQTLARHRDRLHGTVRFLFQPGEEVTGGARYMVEDGVMEDVDAVFGLHGWPSLPVGQIALKPGRFMASADMFRIDVTGRGCHGAEPTAGIDPIVAAAHIVTGLHTLVSREISPHEPAVVTVGHFDAGNTCNIIPDTALLEGTTRAFSDAVHNTLREGIKRITEHTAAAFRATATVRFGEVVYPALHNDPDTTEFVREVALDTLGQDRLIELARPLMVAEDFAYYLQKAPGAFFFLGVGSAEGPPHPPLHSARYDFNDDAIPVAMALMSSIAVKFLAKN
jgi:hippurate hydrolase